MKAIFYTIICFCFASLVTTENITNHPNWHLFDHEQCGESTSDRIIGGTVAFLGQYPWMARLGYNKILNGILKRRNVFKCGATLINNMYVLTAAHCVTELKRGDVLSIIRLGEHNSKTDIDCQDDMCAPPVQDFQPSKIVYHKYFQKPAMRNDIALIRLDRPVTINAFVSPICLPYDYLLNKDFTNSIMEVAGWGVNDIRVVKTSPILLHVRVPIVPLSICEETLKSYTTLASDGQLCAGGKIGYDSCGGDSGGPLMKPEALYGPPKFYLVGIVSFGSVKCGSDAPAIYTRVAYYMNWILDNVEP